MDVTELHDEENLLVQMQDRWENYGSLDAIVDTHDPFTLEGAPRFELSEKIDSLLSHALTEDERSALPLRYAKNLLLRQTLGMGCKQRSVKSVQDMELKSLKKKYKSKGFAAGCSREVIEQGAEMLGWPLDEVLQKTLDAMRDCEARVASEMEEI